MTRQGGFTLVEAMITGVLSTIVAGTLVTVLSMVNTQIKEGSLEARMHRLQTVASEQIRASARRSWGILLAGEVVGGGVVFADLAEVPHSQEVRLCNKDGVTMSKYKVDPLGYLLEWHFGDPGDYYRFKVGDETIQVDPVNCDFSIAPGRKSMKFKLAHTLEGRSLPLIEETIQCRNLSN